MTQKQRSLLFDVVVVGGGFYGCMIALSLSKRLDKVLLVEKEKDLLTRASYNNQARVHNGYHYPRSFITALRSHINHARFVSEFKEAIEDEISMVYAIASNFSKVTSRQFIKFCQKVGSPLKPAQEEIKNLFDKRLIEEVFAVEEHIFNAAILRDILKKRLKKKGVSVLLEEEVVKVARSSRGFIEIHLKDGRALLSRQVFNCTYSQINNLLKNSDLPRLPLKHEFTEMPLVQVPRELENIGITIMDGPFFGVLPFPDRGLHTVHHVRYTPHLSWVDDQEEGWPDTEKLSGRSEKLFILKDAKRYMPILADAKYKDSIYEVKTVLTEYEFNDRRPILFRKDHGIKGLHVVMGGKIDNVYDVLQEIERKVM